MTLQSSSNAQPQTILPTSTEEPEVVLLDTPVNHKQQRKTKEDYSSLGDCPKTPQSHADSEPAASPSVSAVIDALHLSDIDWEALSFTSSPSATNHCNEPKLSTDIEAKETEGENNKQKTSCGVKEGDSSSAPECSLRDRVLMRTTAKAVDQMEIPSAMISKLLNYELAPLKHTSSHNSETSERIGGILVGQESAVNKKEPLTDRRQCTKHKTDTHSSKQQLRPALQTQNKTKDKCNGSQKPPQKYKFVRKAIPSSALSQQTCHSDPDRSDKNVPHTTKKTVCMSVGSSSEESDAENQQLRAQRKAKMKPVNKIKASSLSDFPLKAVSTKPTAKTAPINLSQLKAQSCIVAIETNSMPVSAKSQTVSPAVVSDDVFLQTPASPVTVLDSDDSVISGESPLPLAERLRLKFLKWAASLQDHQEHVSYFHVECERLL